MPFKPYAHQTAALQKMRGRDSFALLMGMRTGKSKVVIDEWFEDGCPDLSIIAPAGAYRTWEVELQKHVPTDILRRVAVGTWVSDAGPKSVAHLHGHRGPRVLLANVEAYSSVAAVREVTTQFLSRRATLIVDESTTIKSTKSKRSKVIYELGQLAGKRRILSGLPTPRSPLDLYGQFEFLDHDILGFVSEKAFKQRYANWRKMKVGAWYIDVVVDYKNVEELWAKIEPHSFRTRLEDCADVPAKVYITRDVELTREQKRMYAEMKRYATTQFESGEWASSQQVVNTMMRLHQICCGHLTDDDQRIVREIPNTRVHDLLDLLDDHDGKVIIWCSYDHDIRAISQALRRSYGNESVTQFWGGNQTTREEDSRRFKEDPRCRYMVATPGSGGRGRTWPEASLIVYYSNTDNLEHRDQSEERASSVEKTDRVTVVDMMARGTVEEKIIHALRKKIDLAAVVTNDAWREWVV